MMKIDNNPESVLSQIYGGKKEIVNMTPAIDFGGTNYYAPNRVFTLPTTIDNALANSIIVANTKVADIYNRSEYNTALSYYNVENSADVVANNICITINSLYKRLINDINNIFRVLFEDKDTSSKYIHEHECTYSDNFDIIRSFVMFYNDSIYNSLETINREETEGHMKVGMFECVNGIGINIYNSTFADFSDFMYKLMVASSDFEKVANEYFSEYYKAFALFMQDLVCESNGFAIKAYDGILMLLSSRLANRDFIAADMMHICHEDEDNEKE